MQFVLKISILYRQNTFALVYEHLNEILESNDNTTQNDNL